MLRLPDSIPDSVEWGQPVNWSHPLNRGLVSWWLAVPQGRTGYGTLVWRDLCRLYDGALGGIDPAADWTPPLGRPGGFGAIRMDGATSEGVTLTAPPVTAAPLTVAAWVRPSSLAAVNYVCGIRSPGNSNGWAFGLNATTAVLQFSMFGVIVVSSSATGIATNTWYRVGMSYDQSQVLFYLNGNLVSQHSETSAVSASSGSFMLGSYHRASSPGSIPAINGYLDDVRIHNVAWGDAQFRADYQQATRFYPGMLNRIPMPRWRAPDDAAFPWLYARRNQVIGGGL